MNTPSLRSRLAACFGVLFLGAVICGGGESYGQAAVAASPGASSLVSNGDFSKATDPTWPDDWPKAKGATYEAESGMHFLRLMAAEPDLHLMVYREVAIPAGVKNVQISIKYRTAGVVVGSQNWMDARAIFHFLDDSRKNLAPDPKPLIFSKEAGTWTTVSETCPVPDNATKLALMPSLFKVTSGTLDMAEITVSPAQ